MFYLKLVYNVIAIMCIIYAVFRPMDILSWWFVKGKKVVLWIYEWLKGFIK